jgi:hypothetical protein
MAEQNTVMSLPAEARTRLPNIAPLSPEAPTRDGLAPAPVSVAEPQ